MGIRFWAGAADDDFYPVTDGIHQAAVTGRKGDGQQVGIARLAEGQGVAFRMGGEAAPEVTMQGLVLGQIDAGRLTVETNPADAPFLTKDGATDFVVAVRAGRGGGLGETKGELDPFLFHGRQLFFRNVQAMQDAVKDGREDDPEKGDQHDPAKEGIGGGKQLGGYGGEALPVDRTLSSHQHGGFDEGILPRQSPERVVTDNPDAQGEADQSDRHGEMQQDPPEEDMVRGQGLAVVLKGHLFDLDRLNCQTKEA